MKRNGDLVRHQPWAFSMALMPAVIALGLVIGLSFPAGTALPAKLVPESPPTWERTYGGARFDVASSIRAVPAGGFVFSGYRQSKASGKAVAWIRRMDERGDEIWDGAYGENKRAISILPLAKGGFVAVGESHDVSTGNTGGITDGGLKKGSRNNRSTINGSLHPGSVNNRAWMLRLDPNGKKLWERIFTESKYEIAETIVPVPGGGFYLGGYSFPKNILVRDAWVMRVDAGGRKLWKRSFAGKRTVSSNAMAALPAGGVALAGVTKKGNGKNQKAWVIRLDDKGNLLWQRTFDENKSDSAHAIAAAPDGGMVVTGVMSDSIGTRFWVSRLDAQGLETWLYFPPKPRNISPAAILAMPEGGFLMAGDFNKGGLARKGDPQDAYLLKLDGKGGKVWERIEGGDKADVPISLASAPGGGFVLAGYTESKGAGEADAWVLRLDRRGRDTWNRKFGGAGVDGFLAIATLSDGGVAMGGINRSTGDGRVHAWVVGLDPQGAAKWNRTLGGEGRDMALAIAPAEGGGLVLAGLTKSQGTRVDDDLLVVRLDEKGNLLWKRALGGSQNDAATSIVVLPDGDIMLAGFTRSKGRGRADCWILRLNGQGKVLWERTFGGSGFDIPWAIVPVVDGGFLFAGETGSGGREGRDAWVMRLDGQGDPLWEKKFGGKKYDIFSAILPLAEGGFLLAGNTESKGAGRNDGWVVRLDAQGGMLWERVYGKENKDAFWSIAGVPGVGFAVAGQTGINRSGDSDAWVLLLDGKGRVRWEKTFGGKKGDSARAIMTGPKGGFIVAGSTESNGAGLRDGWVFRLDENGRLR